MSGARFSFLRSFPRWILGSLAILSLAGCATATKRGEFTEREMMEAACPVDFSAKTVKGSIWTKVESKEMNGQFPATVLSEYPVRLAVEVTNLIGAPQAWLKIENGKTELRFTEENEKEYGKPPAARSMLGGLPLELAPRLFAGGAPCPSDTKNHDVRVHENAEGGLEVEELDLRTRDRIRFTYVFTRYAGKPWVKEIRWERVVKSVNRPAKASPITFFREEPTEPDGAPRKWSATSSAGEIRVRWKDRTVSKP